jgi:hypothetical protein
MERAQASEYTPSQPARKSPLDRVSRCMNLHLNPRPLAPKTKKREREGSHVVKIPSELVVESVCEPGEEGAAPRENDVADQDLAQVGLARA